MAQWVDFSIKPPARRLSRFERFVLKHSDLLRNRLLLLDPGVREEAQHRGHRWSLLHADRAHGGAGFNTCKNYRGIASAVTMVDGVPIWFGILDPSSVGAPMCLELAVAVRADQPKVLGVVVSRIPINVVEDEPDRSRLPGRVLSVQRTCRHIAAFRNTAQRTPRQVVTLGCAARRPAVEIVGQHIRFGSLANAVSHWRVRLTICSLPGWPLTVASNQQPCWLQPWAANACYAPVVASIRMPLGSAQTGEYPTARRFGSVLRCNAQNRS